jgi:hypothetical protein
VSTLKLISIPFFFCFLLLRRLIPKSCHRTEPSRLLTAPFRKKGTKANGGKKKL